MMSDALLPSLTRTDDSDAVIMHPGVLCIMVRLLPRLYHEDHPQVLVDEHTGLCFSHDCSFRLLWPEAPFPFSCLCPRSPVLAEPPSWSVPAGEYQWFWDLWLSATHPFIATQNRLFCWWSDHLKTTTKKNWMKWSTFMRQVQYKWCT